jgi:hypothetical protein
MYKQLIDPISGQVASYNIFRVADGAYIPFDPANSDYQAYLKFLEEGGQPLPPDEVGDA